jgi:hypothetical protein
MISEIATVRGFVCIYNKMKGRMRVTDSSNHNMTCER